MNLTTVKKIFIDSLIKPVIKMKLNKLTDKEFSKMYYTDFQNFLRNEINFLEKKLEEKKRILYLTMKEIVSLNSQSKKS